MGYQERETEGDCPVCGYSVVAWEPGKGIRCYRCYTEEKSEAWNTAARLRAEVESLRQDAERYRWLKSRKGLTLRSDFSIWYKTDGRQFINTHYLAEGGTQHGPGESMDEIIDAAMAVERG